MDELGMIGLGVMGRSLALNMADHGFSVAGYDKDIEKVRLLEASRTAPRARAAENLPELLAGLRRPRVVMMLVPAGPPVDAVLGDLMPRLAPGDVVIDGGNSYFKDTDRRARALVAGGVRYLGVGISQRLVARQSHRGPARLLRRPYLRADRCRGRLPHRLARPSRRSRNGTGPSDDWSCPMNEGLPEIYLARHGETAWNLTHQHTGRTDLPLTPRGEQNARQLGRRLQGIDFQEVWTSPLRRALQTCTLAGFGDRAKIEPDLMEIDYGQYEGRRSVDIRQQRPGWNLFRDGCPGGESVAEIVARADRVVERLRAFREGQLLLFSHRHFLRFLAARWILLPGPEGQRFMLGTAALSILSYEHAMDNPAILLWNDDHRSP